MHRIKLSGSHHYIFVVSKFLRIIGILLALANRSMANEADNIQLTQSEDKISTLRLIVHDASLGQILKTIASKTGAIIHYSVLPEAPVSATCVGANVGQILDCLLAKQVGLIGHQAQKDKPAEFWLLGSSVGSCQSLTTGPQMTPLEASDEVNPAPTPAEQAQAEQAIRKQSDHFLAQTKAKDPSQRAEAISNLISSGATDDPNVRQALEEALTDKDAVVRAQAVTALALSEGKEASAALQHALNDVDADVRLAAVDNAGDDAALLQQALADKNSMVRNYAADKLKALNETANRK